MHRVWYRKRQRDPRHPSGSSRKSQRHLSSRSSATKIRSAASSLSDERVRGIGERRARAGTTVQPKGAVVRQSTSRSTAKVFLLTKPLARSWSEATGVDRGPPRGFGRGVTDAVFAVGAGVNGPPGAPIG